MKINLPNQWVGFLKRVNAHASLSYFFNKLRQSERAYASPRSAAAHIDRFKYVVLIKGN